MVLPLRWQMLWKSGFIGWRRNRLCSRYKQKLQKMVIWRSGRLGERSAWSVEYGIPHDDEENNGVIADVQRMRSKLHQYKKKGFPLFHSMFEVIGSEISQLNRLPQSSLLNVMPDGPSWSGLEMVWPMTVIYRSHTTHACGIAIEIGRADVPRRTRIHRKECPEIIFFYRFRKTSTQGTNIPVADCGETGAVIF